MEGALTTSETVAADLAQTDSPVEPPLPADDALLELTFEKLSDFPYDPPRQQYDEEGDALPIPSWPDPVPERIKALAGRRIAVEGYLIPLDYAEERCSKFVVAQFIPTCCFGDTIKANQWIGVKMKDGERIRYRRGVNRVEGVLQIVPHETEAALTSLYEMTGERVTALDD